MKTYQKVLIVIGIVMAVLITAIIFMFSWEGDPKKIVATADKFQPPASWELESERQRGPRLICIEGGCPSVFRAWRYDTPLTRAQLSEILDQTNWEITYDEKCDEMGDAARENDRYPCTAQIVTEDYEGAIYITKDGMSDKTYRFSLSLDPQ